MGKYPTVYQFEENDERYMLGSDVGAYLGFYKGALYKRFPSLERRILNAKEREALSELNIDNRTLCNMGTMVVKASEAMDILKGDDEYYRRKNTTTATQNNEAKEAINVAFCRKRSSRTDLADLRENLTFVPTATKLGKKQSTVRRIIPKKQTVIEKPSEIALDYPNLACTVMNNVTLELDDESTPVKRRRKQKLNKQVEKMPEWKLSELL